MKRKDLYNYLQVLTSVSDLKGVKFAYAVIKNKKKIENEIKILEEIIIPNPLFEEFEKKRIVLCEVHSEKDTNGNPTIIENKYKISDLELFNTELEKLRLNYKDIIDERYKQINDYNNILDEDTEMEFTKIGYIDLPINISAKELDSIDFMVNLD